MESLRERFLIETGQDDGSALEHVLSDAADGLYDDIVERIRREAKIEHGDIGFWERRMLQVDGEPVQAIFGSNYVEPEDIRKTKGYREIHEQVAAEHANMAVEIVPGSSLRKSVSGEPLDNPDSHVIVVILSKPYSASSDAGIHLEESERPEPEPAPSM